MIQSALMAAKRDGCRWIGGTVGPLSVAVSGDRYRDEALTVLVA
jgi:hypothetical protein